MSAKIPKIRSFVPCFPPSSAEKSVTKTHGTLRVLQFNVLADGLSGLRPDLGDFSRTKPEDIVWENRKHLLFDEILQYEADVITLQECDHFHDFFEPQLSAHGEK